MDRFIQLGMAAGIEAFRTCGLEITETNAARIGVHLGSGIGGVGTIEATTRIFLEKGPRRVSPFYVPMSIANMLAGDLSIMLGAKGPNLTMVTACSTGTHSIGDAARLIEYGDADVMIAGGAEAAVTGTAMAGFGNAKALSTRNDDPEAASRPWDRDRDGFVMSEGAGVLVLEELEHARKRDATIYAELAGFGLSGDAYHMTSPSEGGEGAVQCMQNALRNGGINPEQVHYINAHGTSTLLGDRAETVAIKTAFREHCTAPSPPSDGLVMIAGGAEAAVTGAAMAGFGNAKALSTRNDDPEAASRPWDRDRDGFVMSEGAGVLVLEELEHARKRDATIYAELAGFGLSGDAYHMTSPSEGGEGAVQCMQNALRNGGINPEQVHYINAHGTSTLLGDRAETVAIKTAFREHAHKLVVSSTKSMVGHLLGAAGGVEAVYTALAIYHQIVPPTINLDNPDPDCDLDFVPGSAREMTVDVALSNSFGFGGTNGTLVLCKPM